MIKCQGQPLVLFAKQVYNLQFVAYLHVLELKLSGIRVVWTLVLPIDKTNFFQLPQRIWQLVEF